MDLFEYMSEKKSKEESPLASRMRPKQLNEIVGQQHILGEDKYYTYCYEKKKRLERASTKKKLEVITEIIGQPLPDGLLADYRLGIYDKISRTHIRRSGICPWLIIVLDHIVAFIIDGPERQRPDLAYPGPAHIKEVHELLRVHYLVSGRIASLIETCLAAFVHGGTFHDEYLVHAISHALGNQRWVVIYAVRERIRNQPAARKGMIICRCIINR